MELPDVIRVLDRLDAAGVGWRVDGGWGVDALLGRQTRAHRDLDLAVRPQDVAGIEAALSEYRRVDTGEWPRFLVLEDAAGRRVDLDLRQTRATSAPGRIGPRDVSCVTVGAQLATARPRDANLLRAGIR